MARSLSSKEQAEINLTPILDMVFQLITFFMLVINFKTASMDMSLHLPAVGTASPVDFKGQDLVVLNVDPKGALKHFGFTVAIEEIPAYVAKEAQASLLTARRLQPELKLGDDLPSMVVIRADKETPFRMLNRVLASCQENGYRNFSLKKLSQTSGP